MTFTFYAPKDTKIFLNLLSFGTILNTFIFLNPPLPPFEGGNKYIHVFYVSGHVFYVSGHVFYVSGHVFYVSGHVLYVSGHVFYVSGHVCLRVGTRLPTCRDTSSYVSGHVFYVSGHVCLRVWIRLLTCRDTSFISVYTYRHKYKTPIRFKTLSALCK